MNCLLDFHLSTMDTIVHEYASFTDTITHNCFTNVMITESNMSEYQMYDKCKIIDVEIMLCIALEILC